MLKVALTGNVASGKTTVAEIWSGAGIPLVRADDLAREVVVPGSQGLSRVVEAFGEEVLLEDGTLARTELRDRIVEDAGERRRLEEILHPLIGALRDSWMKSQEKAGATLVVAEIPLLFEVGLEGEYDVVVLVSAPSEERLRRLVADRGMTEDAASGLMATQIPDEEKVSKADYLLDNSGTGEDLEIRSLALLDLLRARARKGDGR
jgi:dephospho-CoA kinase